MDVRAFTALKLESVRAFIALKLESVKPVSVTGLMCGLLIVRRVKYRLVCV